MMPRLCQPPTNCIIDVYFANHIVDDMATTAHTDSVWRFEHIEALEVESKGETNVPRKHKTFTSNAPPAQI